MSAMAFCAHAGALLLITVLPIALGYKIALAALIGASYWWQVSYGAGASRCEIRLGEDGSCLRTGNGEQRRYRIERATVHAGFVRLTLQRAGERTHIQLVPRDAVAPEIYRTLCAGIVQRRLPVADKTPA